MHRLDTLDMLMKRCWLACSTDGRVLLRSKLADAYRVMSTLHTPKMTLTPKSCNACAMTLAPNTILARTLSENTCVGEWCFDVQQRSAVVNCRVKRTSGLPGMLPCGDCTMCKCMSAANYWQS